MSADSLRMIAAPCYRDDGNPMVGNNSMNLNSNPLRTIRDNIWAQIWGMGVESTVL